MTNTDLGACDQFLYELRRSNLVERGQLDQVLEEFLRANPCPEPGPFAEHLVATGVLTPFQAERIAQGKSQGLVLGPYILLDSIGAGSMGSVYKAQSKADGRCYAVKVLPRRSMWNVRLARRQVRVFAQFTHATVVPFVDVGTAGGLHYLVWNYVEGETLEALVQRLGKLEPVAAAQIGRQIAAGLALAHQQGLFHGLLKPSNVMIGGDGQVRILDFGIGSLLAENEGESLVDTMSTANTLTSGLDCASPESIMEPTNRTPAGDQYSLGCILYFCLTGHYPFSGSAVEKMMAHQFKQPPSLAEAASGAPPEMVALVERLMQKKPEERYAELDEVLHGLMKLAPEQPAVLQQVTHEAMVQTPRQQLTWSNMPRRQSVEARRVELLAQPPQSAQATGPAPSDSGALPLRRSSATPLSASNTPAARSSLSSINLAPLPTRKSLQGDPKPPPAGESGVRLDDPPSPRSSVAPFMFIPPGYDEEDQTRPALGPLGLLALGATVAVACFMVVHNLIK